MSVPIPGMPRIFRGGKAAVLLWTAAVCSVLVWNSSFFFLEFAMRESAGSHLERLGPVAEYLSPPLEAGDYAKFEGRISAVTQSMERNGISNSMDEYLALIEGERLAEACLSKESADGPLLNLCEWRTIRRGGTAPLDCGSFSNSDVRSECRHLNDVRFSVDSDAHCSKAECVIDNAAFKSSVTSTQACSSVPWPLSEGCLKISDAFVEYRKNPSKFESPELESALSWMTEDEIWLAARSAVIDFPDSPWEACEKVPKARMAECETKTKSLFSYVQLRWMKNRLKRISEAVTEYEKTHAKR